MEGVQELVTDEEDLDGDEDEGPAPPPIPQAWIGTGVEQRGGWEGAMKAPLADDRTHAQHGAMGQEDGYSSFSARWGAGAGESQGGAGQDQGESGARQSSAAEPPPSTATPSTGTQAVRDNPPHSSSLKAAPSTGSQTPPGSRGETPDSPVTETAGEDEDEELAARTPADALREGAAPAHRTGQDEDSPVTETAGEDEDEDLPKLTRTDALGEGADPGKSKKKWSKKEWRRARAEKKAQREAAGLPPKKSHTKQLIEESKLRQQRAEWLSKLMPCALEIVGGVKNHKDKRKTTCARCRKKGHEAYECPGHIYKKFNVCMPGFNEAGVR